MVPKAVKRQISRSMAEEILSQHLMAVVREYHVRAPCEYFSWFGGPCPGLNRVSDTELHEIYHGHIPGVEELSGQALLDAVIEFERARLDPEHPVPCALPPLFCNGFSRFSNTELVELFPALLGDYEVVG